MTSITPLYLLCWSCRRARTTWYGYVVTTANIFDNAAIVIYSSGFCLHGQKKKIEGSEHNKLGKLTSNCNSSTVGSFLLIKHLQAFCQGLKMFPGPSVAYGVTDSPALHLKRLSCICWSLSWALHRPWTAALHGTYQTDQEHNPVTTTCSVSTFSAPSVSHVHSKHDASIAKPTTLAVAPVWF